MRIKLVYLIINLKTMPSTGATTGVNENEQIDVEWKDMEVQALVHKLP